MGPPGTKIHDLTIIQVEDVTNQKGNQKITTNVEKQKIVS